MLTTAQDNATLARTLYDAYNRRDFDTSISLATEDVEIVNVPFDLNVTGLANLRAHLESWISAFPDSKIEVVNLVAGDDWVTAECIGRGTHTGGLKGPRGTIAPTGKRIELRFCELIRIRNGKKAESHVYFDSATLMRQLGVKP